LKVIGIIGTSVLGKNSLVEDLFQAIRFDGWTVSSIKHAPDGFDLDQPGKSSYRRREAGCRDVMLVEDRRLVLMQKYGADREPPLDALISRLDPIDLVIVEGFKGASVPTIEVCGASSGRAPRWPRDKHVVALVSPVPVATPLPTFTVEDTAGLAAVCSHTWNCSAETRLSARTKDESSAMATPCLPSRGPGFVPVR